MQKSRFEYQHSVRGCEWAIVAPILVGILVALVGMIYASIAGIDAKILQTNTIYLCIGSVMTELSFLAVAFYIARRNRVGFLDGTGMRVTSPWWTYLVAIIVSVLVLLLLNPLINCWQTLLQTLGHSIVDLPLAVDSIPMLILAIVIFALIPAFCEEILFRGVILNGLRKYGMWTSILISAAFFSIMHMNLLQLPYTFLLGVVLGIVVYTTRNLGLGILMHFANNATVLIAGYFSAGYAYNFVWYDILIALGGVILFGALLYILYKYLVKKFLPTTQATEAQQLSQTPLLEKSIRKRMWCSPCIIGGACLIISILGAFGIL